MADTSGWISIKKMVKEILLETGRDEGQYKLLMHHVINGVRELNIFHYDNVKTIKVTCNSLGIIDLSTEAPDYIQLVKLSMNYQGLMYPLTRQDMMVRTLSDGDEDGSYSLDSTIGEGVALSTGGDYSYATLGAKNDYYYTVDERNTRILVRDIPTRTLFLQYISSGIDLDDGNGTLIPIKLKKALKYYVMLQDAIMNDSVDKRLVPLYERNYNGAISELGFIELPSASELEDMIYATYSEIRR